MLNIRKFSTRDSCREFLMAVAACQAEIWHSVCQQRHRKKLEKQSTAEAHNEKDD